MKRVNEFSREEKHETADLLKADFVGCINSNRGTNKAEVERNNNRRYNQALILFLLRSSKSLPAIPITNHVTDDFSETLNSQHRVITSNDFYLAVVKRRVNGTPKVLCHSNS